MSTCFRWCDMFLRRHYSRFFPRFSPFSVASGSSVHSPCYSGKQVLELQYEAYVPKAIKTLAAIASEARQLALSGNFSSPSLTANLPGPPSEPAHPVNVVSSAVQPVAASPDLVRIIIAHRLGIVPPTETSIVIVVSCGRRRESFTACEWILEAVKKKAEVWKREMYADDDDQGVWKANF